MLGPPPTRPGRFPGRPRRNDQGGLGGGPWWSEGRYYHALMGRGSAAKVVMATPMTAIVFRVIPEF